MNSENSMECWGIIGIYRQHYQNVLFSHQAVTFFLHWLQASEPCLVASSQGTFSYRPSSEPKECWPNWPTGSPHHKNSSTASRGLGSTPPSFSAQLQWRLQQSMAAEGFPVSGSPALSAQITQDSGWLFLLPTLRGQKAPGDSASSAAAVCGLQALCYLPPAASPLTGSFPRLFHHRKFPVGKHSVSKQRVPCY